ncbi:SICA antigen [Plasmodium coatneyi]|uniref:SICA antigen n=1 Tax=Plasmodium coatneyi TaxID=208452 RepID=A0A1B1E0Z9_9APIC|nr:SICA antigen [Plasmodium coatneyi]ANQ08713.1 SICA antigen [Plasmodium coatneyi]
MIIDIYLEVLDECQRGNLHSKKEDFLEILVQEFTGNGFIKGKNVPKEQVPRSDSGFTEEDFVPKEQVQVPKESVPMVGVPKEQLLSSGFGFREGSLCS